MLLADHRKLTRVFDHRHQRRPRRVHVQLQPVRLPARDALTSVAQLMHPACDIRRRLGDPVFAKDECFPSEVDMFGYDIYSYVAPTHPRWARLLSRRTKQRSSNVLGCFSHSYDNSSFLDSKAAFVQNVYPRMWPHQHIVPVTESFAPNRSSGTLCALVGLVLASGIANTTPAQTRQCWMGSVLETP